MADKVMLSVKDPEEALRVMAFEKLRRTEFFWKTADGTVVNVREMTDGHLNNAIHCLRRMVFNKEVCLENEEDALNDD